MSLKSCIKGWLGELQSTFAKKIALDSKIYTDINNVTIPSDRGTTQIDHVIASRYGIFVVETKNMDGWIFGDEKSPQWTQGLFGKKYRFQNPLRQNYRHTKALSELLGIGHEKFISVVMFWGDCQFKTPLPRNVLNRGYTAFIKSHRTILLSEQEVIEIVDRLRNGMLSKSWSTNRTHVAALKERHSNTTTCPKCGSSLAIRTAKSGINAGSRLYGCTKYPACRYAKPFNQ